MNEKKKSNELESKSLPLTLAGLIVALAVVLISFEWKTFDRPTTLGTSVAFLSILEEDVVAPTIPEKPKPMAAVEKREVDFSKAPEKGFEEEESKQEEENKNEEEGDEGDNNNDEKEWSDEGMFGEEEEEKDITDSVHIDSEIWPHYDYKYSLKDEQARRDYTYTKIAKHFRKEIKYPAFARDNQITGKVYVSFVVNRKGKVTQVKAINKVHSSLEQEAMRIVEALPDFIPALHKGQKVSMLYRVPVVFRLQ